MAPDAVTQERIYQALKQDLRAGAARPGARLDLQRIADRHRASITPVREAMFRLMGEGLVEPYTDGGFQIVLPDATQLLHLYVWNLQQLLAALHIVRDAPLSRALETRRRIAIAPGAPPAEQAQAIAEFFAAIGEATGNGEFIAQIAGANDRLHHARVAESAYFGDAMNDLRTLARISGANVQKGVRRRILAYHRRRIEHVAQIRNLLEHPPRR